MYALLSTRVAEIGSVSVTAPAVPEIGTVTLAYCMFPSFRIPVRTVPLSRPLLTVKATFQEMSTAAVAINAGFSRTSTPSTAIPSVVNAGTVVVVPVLERTTGAAVVALTTVICPRIHGCGEQMYGYTPSTSNV